MAQQVSNTETRLCYSNGVKQVSTVLIGMTLGLKQSYFRSGGALCYTAETPIPLEGAGGAIAVTYKNGAGTVVGTTMLTLATQNAVYTCAGQAPVTVNLNACSAEARAASNPMSSASSMCSNGICM